MGVMGIVTRDERRGIRGGAGGGQLDAVAIVGVERIDLALRTVFCHRKAVASGVFCHPGQHSNRHQGKSAGARHLGHKLSRVGVERRIAHRAIHEIEVVGSIGVEVHPVVAGGRVAAPAHNGQSAVGNGRSIFRESAAVNVLADGMTIAEHIDGHMDGGRRRGRSCGNLARIRTFARRIHS